MSTIPHTDPKYQLPFEHYLRCKKTLSQTADVGFLRDVLSRVRVMVRVPVRARHVRRSSRALASRTLAETELHSQRQRGDH